MPNSEQQIVYDVDTSAVVERVVQSRSKRKMVWTDGKIRTYGLHQNGDSRKLQSVEEWL